ncbi:synaptic vesicle protein [Culex quinquefasciatus]|uniref:Synaptic vesicle protein n=1 Tax=Culex quinquefasciatus TaxID=7176 RepID=B0WEX7_CULQU|nr:synaptic vesicle glycoprotein 2B [Culex quinquefasciatus]EDS25835.1 synaptic vesicle protein [Culex quinquefasciatus]|eukprot:XP_001847261.1 synaptic vesicle protein [Culex quinquefasciatus]
MSSAMENAIEVIPEPKHVNYQRSITLDDALSLTKFGKVNYFLIIVAGTILAAVLLETLGISYVIPVARCDLEMTTQEKGVLSAVSFAGIIVSSHLWGFLADTRGRKKVIVPTLFLTFFCSFISSFSTNFWLITVLRFFAGFFISGSSATIYAYVGEFHNRRNGSRAIMGASFVFGIGCLMLPAIAYFVINQEWEFTIPLVGMVYRPWRLFLVVCGMPSLVCGLALCRFPESPKFVFMQGKKDEAIETIQWMHKLNTSGKEAKLQIVSIIDETEAQQTKARRKEAGATKGFVALMKLMWNQTAPLFMTPYLNKTAIVCVLQFGIYLTSNGMYMFFPYIVNRIAEIKMDRITACNAVRFIPEELAAVNVTEVLECDSQSQKLDISTYEHSFILELMYALGFAVIGLVINAVGKLPILVFVFVSCGVSGILMVYIDVPALVIWLYLILLTCGFCISVVNAATIDLFPTNLRAMAVCISLMCGRAGSVVGANMVGLLLDSNCELTFWISGASLIGCGVLSFFIPNIYKRTITEPRVSVSSR